MVSGSFESENVDMNKLGEPLLDHGDSEARGCDTVTGYANAGFFSTLSFSWIRSLLSLGAKKTTLDLHDIPQLRAVDSVFEFFPIFRKRFLELSPEVANDNGGGGRTRGRVVITKLGLVKALFLSGWKEIILTAFMVIICTLARFVGPFLIDSFVQCLNGGGQFKNEGYILAFTFCFATLLRFLIEKHMSFQLLQVGYKLRGATIIMLYQKCFVFSGKSSKSDGEASGGGGEFINAVAVDVETIYSFIRRMHDPWSIILQVGLALILLYKNLGLAASIAAFVVAVGFMLLNSLFATWQEKFQDKLMQCKDDRMKLTMETIRNMRILKFQGWEMSFLSKILQLRDGEMQWFKRFLFNTATMSFFISVSPTIVALITFGSSILMGIPLETGKILSALATFRVLHETIIPLPDTISMLIQFKVSIGRIASILSLDELQLVDAIEEFNLGSHGTAIEIVDGNFSWDDTSLSTIATLRNINFKVSQGMRVAICGTVGSGKSSLLSCILGEMPKISGAVMLKGTKAYVAQSPWIQSGTIQENILFGKKMDQAGYDQVLEACCLKKDLEMLSFGDQTIIGERGINLSGGQKQRIQIARALYRDADIYLFDDPFSAVDAHTGSHLFKEVFLGLLSGKTVVYVTHQVEFLNAADVIVVMKDGQIAQMGKYSDLVVAGSDFVHFVGAQNAALSVLNSTMEADTGPGNDNESCIKEQPEGKKSTSTNHYADGESKETDSPPDADAQLIQEEERENGSVGFLVHWRYITASHTGALVFLALLGLLLAEFFQIGINYCWTRATPAKNNAEPVAGGNTLVFALLTIGISFSTLAKDLLLAIAAYKTTTVLFRKMLQSIFLAPMCFFDATPSGRILNRCSKDQTAVETEIPSALEGFCVCTIELLGIVAVMSIVSWQVLLIFIPVILTSIWYQRYYMLSSRELSRLSGVCHAPIIQQFSETISGITTIRTFGEESRFQATYMKLLDTYTRPEFHRVAAMCWLLVRLDAFSCVIFAFQLVASVYFAERIDPAIAGLAVTYGLNLNNALAGFIWCLCHFETKMISVERILQYMSVPSEAPLTIPANTPDCSWPSNGEIQIENLQVQYAPHLPLVLRDVTCTFPGGMKTGIVGRTGSGKSTLIQSLFRLVEPTGGRIVLDGVDISSIGIHDLRSRLSIIPQDPTMFQGTIRTNLDPLEQYTDMQIWEALDKCQLGDEVRRMERKLDSIVNENGENWSMGQRQLICLGRVLLKKSKVLVLDEATASVDAATDNLIQQTLQKYFSHCTLITIAHRITSVLDSDMVLVLNQGAVEEYDSPGKLLQIKSSAFTQLVAEFTRSSRHIRS